jgi:hypothetical protein
MTALPGEEDKVGFEAQIRPLLRQRDRSSMVLAFDLWSYDDVHQHSARILAWPRSGTMPCDGPWIREQIQTFPRWIDGGMVR